MLVRIPFLGCIVSENQRKLRWSTHIWLPWLWGLRCPIFWADLVRYFQSWYSLMFVLSQIFPVMECNLSLYQVLRVCSVPGGTVRSALRFNCCMKLPTNLIIPGTHFDTVADIILWRLCRTNLIQLPAPLWCTTYLFRDLAGRTTTANQHTIIPCTMHLSTLNPPVVRTNMHPTRFHRHRTWSPVAMGTILYMIQPRHHRTLCQAQPIHMIQWKRPRTWSQVAETKMHMSQPRHQVTLSLHRGILECTLLLDNRGMPTMSCNMSEELSLFGRVFLLCQWCFV